MQINSIIKEGEKMNLQIDVIQDNATDIVQLNGEIDIYSAPKLKETLIPLTEKENNKIKVDLQHTTYLDSTGLGIFIAAYKSAIKHHSTFQIVRVSNRIFRLFKVTGLSTIIDVQKEAEVNETNE